MSDKKIVVPTDFSSVGTCAADHAAVTADIIGADVVLLHIVAKQEEVDEAKKKLATEAERLAGKGEYEVETMARVGNIFEDIGDVAKEIGAELIFMGTHGMKGLQFITGSHAMKVITSSSVPFIVVQERGPLQNDGYKNIVVPLDLTRETKQKLNIVSNMARYFQSKIHLITPNESDEFLKNQLTRNLQFSKKFLAERGIQFEVKVGETKGGGFVKELINYSKDNDIDLIAIMNLKENSLMGMIGSSYEQQIITNETQVPVMCINPLRTTVAGGSVLFS